MIAKDINKVVRKGDLTKIENYDKAVADTTQTWVCHHRLELTLDGEFAHKAEDLERMGMYYNRPYFELIFLTPSEHWILHSNSQSDEQKRKNSKSKKGKKHPCEPFSEFGWKYFEHYGYKKSENLNQYVRENRWYHHHNHKCRWEV